MLRRCFGFLLLTAALTGLSSFQGTPPKKAPAKKAPVKAAPARAKSAPITTKSPSAKPTTAKPASAVPFRRTPSGIEYRIYQPVQGRYALRSDVVPTGDPTYSTRVGKVLLAHLQYRTAKDSVLFSTRQAVGAAVPLPLAELSTRGGLEEALTLVRPGDSAVFRFNADSLFARSFRQPVPSFIRKAGPMMTAYVKAEKLLTQDEAMAEQQKLMAMQQQKMQAEAAKQAQQDSPAIEAYVKQQNLPAAQKTPGGTYYIVTRPGSGPKPTTGQTVAVLYKGQLLDGKVFDSSEKNGGQPISFALGTGQVIPGWDQGIAQLSPGAKAVLLIPAALAYGSRGAGADIPPNAILRFDVELVSVN